MGFIPLFIMLGGGALLFYLTVKNALQRKLNNQKELLFKLNSLNPALGILVNDTSDPDLLISALKEKQLEKGIAESLENHPGPKSQPNSIQPASKESTLQLGR